MAGTSDIYTSYLMQKGPLTQEESTLKDLLLRQQMYQYKPQSYTAAPSAAATPSPAPSNVATPPIVGGNNRDMPEFEGVMLPHVSQGDLITASYINDIVDALNGVMDFLEQVTSSQPTTYYSVQSATSPAPASAGIAGVVKEAFAEPAAAGDTVTVKIPSKSIDASDFEALVYGNRRIDPSELVKTDDGLSFQINKADIGTDNPELLAVAKGTNQQVLELFR